MSIVYENYLIVIFCFLTFFFWIKYRLSVKTIANDREYFIKTLSHDIRVSLIAEIRGTELLQKYKTENCEILENLDKNCRYTLDMISMLINTYKYKNKEITLDYEPLILSDLLIKTSEELVKNAKEKEISFDYLNNTNFVTADKILIKKAMHIVLSTIIELSDKHQKIECSIKKFKDNVILDLIYNGHSLTKEEYKTMFLGKFHYSAVGLGIKMHLLKNIIDLHSGKIFVQKTNTGKNSFTIILPEYKQNKSHSSKLFRTLSEFQL